MKRILLLSLLSIIYVTSSAQTLITGGPIEGTSTNHVRITASEYDQTETHVYAGTFVGSVDADFTSGTTMLTATGASGKAGFFAIENDGNFYAGLKLEGTGAADSIVINTIYTDGSGFIYIGGSVYGTVDMDPSGSTSNLTATNGADGFFAKYNALGTFIYASVIYTSGSFGAVTKIIPRLDFMPEIVVYGYFNGQVDVDPTAGTNVGTSAGIINSFQATYDDATGQTLTARRFILGPGTIKVTDAENDWMLGRIAVTGTFDNTLDIDLTAGTTTLTSVGGDDIFVMSIDTGGVLYNHLHLGATSNDRAVDVNYMYDNLYVLGDISGNIMVDPNGSSGTQVNTAGSFDVMVACYTGNLVLNWARTFGNSNPNSSSFARCSMSPMFMPQMAPNENQMQTRGGPPPTYLTYVFGMNFSGTMDADPTSGTANITASNHPTNAVVIELDSAGKYLTNYHTEAFSVRDLFSSAMNAPHTTITGEFIGTNVDLMPYDSVFTLTHTTKAAGFINIFDRCLLSATAKIAHIYPCGTCEADLQAIVTGAIGGVVDAYWGGGVNGLVANDMCPGTYSCEIYDLHNCYAEPFITVMEHSPGSELDGIITTNPSSCGNSVGNATAGAINAIGLVKYLWSDGTMTAFNDSLPAGVYNVQISDSLLCYVTETVVINDVNGPTVTVAATVDPTCAGATTGSIDVTVTGGVAPVTFLWSNGSTSEDLTNVGAGTYAFIATDANGCQTQICVTLTQPQPMTLSNNVITNSDCNTGNGEMSVVVNGGSTPYTYQWGINSGSQTTDTITGLYGGIHTVTVTDAQGCSVTSSFGLNDNNSFTSLYLNWGYSPSCLFGAGYIDIYTSGSDFPYNYVWNTNDMTEDIVLNNGGTFVVAATGASGCISTFSQTFDQILPSSPVVCMVTVDSTSTKNVVIWDKTANVDAVSFNIYREGFCDNTGFGWVGNVSADSLSVFYDTVVNTDERNWQYYVTTIDSCGFESIPSEIHRTIHLSAFYNANNEIRLQWDDYIGEVTYQYNIYRKHPSTGIFELVDSTSGIEVWSLDTSDLSAYGTNPIEYYVEALPVTLCYASRAFNQNAARSNRASISAPVMDTTGITEPQLTPGVLIYPNPTNDVLNISIQGDGSQYQVDLINTIGQTIHSMPINGRGVMSTRELNAGIYFVRVQKEGKPAQVFKVLVTK